MIYKRGKKHTYWFRFRFAGRIIHESARTQSKTLAREAEQVRRRQLELSINGVTGRRALPPTFEKAAEQWLEARKHVIRPNTDKMARIALKQVMPVFGPKLLCDIDVRSIQEYQQRRLATKAQGRTINIEVIVLRQILKANECWLPLEGKIKMLRERKDIGRALTPDEEKRLLDAARGIESACYTAVVLALNTSMRHSEILNLRWSQIDFAQRTLTVGRSKTAAGAGRLIPLNTSAFDALIRWAGRFPHGEPSHFLFPACENKKIDPTRPAEGWRTAWRHARKLAGVQCRFHDLRITCITKMAESQTPDLVIMSLAGHVSRNMLQHYSRIRIDAKRNALEGIAQPVFDGVVHQNGNQILDRAEAPAAKLVN
jgi:integrase